MKQSLGYGYSPKMGTRQTIDIKYKSKLLPHVETVVLLSCKSPDSHIDVKEEAIKDILKYSEVI